MLLRVLDLPIERPGAGTLRVRVTAATVNATDTVLRVAADTYPEMRAADAHRRRQAGGVRGRLVLTFG